VGLLRTSHVSLATLVAAFLAAPAVLAQDAPSGPPPATQYWSDTDVQITPNVTLENHGYFRFRFNELYRLTLGSGGASGFPSTL